MFLVTKWPETECLLYIFLALYLHWDRACLSLLDCERQIALNRKKMMQESLDSRQKELSEKKFKFIPWIMMVLVLVAWLLSIALPAKVD